MAPNKNSLVIYLNSSSSCRDLETKPTIKNVSGMFPVFVLPWCLSCAFAL